MLFPAALLALTAASLTAVKPIDPLPPPAHMAPRPPRYRGITVPIDMTASRIETPRIYGPGDPRRPLIVIDPGHGGHDPGARNADQGWLEKDLTLALAETVKDELLKSGRVRVALTREDDSFLALEERYSIAHDMGAALFISIHADASDEESARGATVYTLSEFASDQEASRLAARENRADILNGANLSGKSSAVSSILIDLAQRQSMAESGRFADLLHRESTPLVDFRTPWHRRAALVVLKSPETPSVLFETGYISNDAEAGRLTSAEGRQKIAQGVAKAVAIYAATLAGGK